MMPLAIGPASANATRLPPGGSHTNDLDLDIDLCKPLAEGVDLDETWVDSTVEATELGDETDITLRDRFVWVRTTDTAGECAHSSNECTQSIDCSGWSAMVGAR
jgi:hypothetical protein